MNLFDRDEFLEFFDNEEIVDTETNEVQYRVTADGDMMLALHISPHEEWAILTLAHKDLEAPLVELGVHNLNNIESDEKNLYFYTKDDTENPYLTIQVKPSVSLTIEL